MVIVSLRSSRLRALVALNLVWTLVGCASAPQRIDQAAAHLGYRRIEVEGKDFVHVVYQNLKPTRGSVLHVYLEGDGTPWIRGRWVADDPTPRNPLMLRLMALDDVDSIYLGRPCYHGFARTPPCKPKYWTSARYSPTVVDSMARVVRRILDERGSQAVCLFGHSGGGTLAMLVAKQLSSTRAVVTLAGNLDVEAWARHHQYTPLSESLNPARQPGLALGVRQLHLVGDNDHRVPPELIRDAVTRWPGAQLRVLEGFSHACCWERIWPSVLAWLKTKVKPSPANLSPRGAASGTGPKQPWPAAAPPEPAQRPR